MRLLAFAGVRPNFVKLEALIAANDHAADGVHSEISVVHVLQHYDADLSHRVAPSYAEYVVAQIGAAEAKDVLSRTTLFYRGVRQWLDNNATPADWVVTMGDAEASLAVALAAASLNLKLCHVEAGMRLPLASAPEAVIARSIDCLAQLRLAASERTFDQLRSEGLEGSHFVGDLYLDTAMRWRDRHCAESGREPRAGRYALISLHHLTDADQYAAIVTTLVRAVGLRGRTALVLEHPRFRSMSGTLSPRLASTARIIPAVSHDAMLRLISDARYVITDSGGLQREACFLSRRCLIPRTDAWWPELVRLGAARCIGDDLDNLDEALDWADAPTAVEPLSSGFGDGRAGLRILDAIATG